MLVHERLLVELRFATVVLLRSRLQLRLHSRRQIVGAEVVEQLRHRACCEQRDAPQQVRRHNRHRRHQGQDPDSPLLVETLTSEEGYNT